MPRRWLALLACAPLAAAAEPRVSDVVVGDVRVQALSPTLLRVEPRGPRGFEDGSTFGVAGRGGFGGVAIRPGDRSAHGQLLHTDHYSVLLRPSCGSRPHTDVTSAVRSDRYPAGTVARDRAECCARCDGDPSCRVWVFGEWLGGADAPREGSAEAPQAANCWPLASFGELRPAPLGRRELGFSKVSFVVSEPGKNGSVLYDSESEVAGSPNLLHWPSPLESRSYALTDFPRFFAPEWGVAPIPVDAKVDVALLPTNGYDFRNNVNGDTYVFLLGSDLGGWSRARGELLQLTGPVPLLPDYAYGTWFTYWHSYTEKEAKDDLQHWEDLDLPLDIWALDMNWRYTDHHKDRYYNYPNSQLFSNFTEWFGYLRSKKLRTYFNDHPFPVASRGAGGLQTSPEEVAFRWEGLSEWLNSGLTFWWFDHNWAFSIPPPFLNTSITSGVWHGLDNAAWGSHVYYGSTAWLDRKVRDAHGDKFYGRPMSLTKFGLPDARAWTDPRSYAESPAQHRYPVWWTGDAVGLQASVQTMVDSGVHGLKPYVHSDCGGDVRLWAGDLEKWTAHCTFGSILRFHGADHRAWTYDNATTATIRRYLQVRYRMAPSLIAAGRKATDTGFPLAARCDLFWPEHKESRSSTQYLFLEDLLVAPMYGLAGDARRLWLPPGDWEDAWDGSIVSGPKAVEARQPVERIPLWYRHDGGLVVLVNSNASRIEDQDWSTLVLEAFLPRGDGMTARRVVERGSGAVTELALRADGRGHVALDFGPSPVKRGWVVRLHLRPGERVGAADVDGKALTVQHLEPQDSPLHMPLAGAGAAPPRLAGPVAELRLPVGAVSRQVRATVVAKEVLVV